MNHLAYRRAKDTLEYIESVKTELSSVLHSKTRFAYTGLHLNNDALTLARAQINEVVDDLYYAYISQARQQIDSCTTRDSVE